MTPDSTPAPTQPLRLTLPRPRHSVASGLASLLLHAVVLAAFVVAQWRGVEAWQERITAGQPDLARGGGGGGGRLQVVSMPAWRAPAAPAPEPVAAPPVRPPEVIPPADEPAPVPAAVQDTVAAAPTPGEGTGTGGGSGSGTGTGQGAGTGPGSGSGTGGGTGGGEGGARGVPPEPRQLILPPLDYPRSLRGHRVAVTFLVGSDGRVDRVDLDRDFDDRGFQRKFVEVMRNYRFRPARDAEGKVTAGVTTVTVTF